MTPVERLLQEAPTPTVTDPMALSCVAAILLPRSTGRDAGAKRPGGHRPGPPQEHDRRQIDQDQRYQHRAGWSVI